MSGVNWGWGGGGGGGGGLILNLVDELDHALKQYSIAA